MQFSPLFLTIAGFCAVWAIGLIVVALRLRRRGTPYEPVAAAAVLYVIATVTVLIVGTFVRD